MGHMQVLGTTDERSSCDCCGRSDLKRTVVLSTEDGSTVYFGTSCAAKALRWSSEEVKRVAKDADRIAREERQRARMVAAKKEFKQWEAYLVRHTNYGLGIKDWQGRPDILRMIAELGGYDAAHDGYTKEMNLLQEQVPMVENSLRTPMDLP